MENFDVVVVGAGTAGCMAAKTIATAGLNVCLVDRKEEKSIGDKVCGDAIGKHHFDNLGLAYPKGEELERDILGAKIYSPDLKTVFRLVGEGLTGFIVNRYLFGQRLLKDAINAGAVLLDSTHVLEPIVENDFVKGVLAENLKKGLKTELRGKVVIDASGFSSVVRSKLPPEMGIEQTISKEDYVICYREIRELKKEPEEPEFIKMYLDLEVAPGGYCWIFPERGTRVNVGLGVSAVEDFQNPRNQLYKYVLSKQIFEESILIHGGGGYDPTRRPLDSLVGNGVVIIGDAACQVNPIDGGGIGPSMIGGKIAGDIIAEALEKGEPDRESLWSINIHYMKTYGAKQAGLDVFRIFLQRLTNEDLNYGMRYKLFKEEDVLKAGLYGDVHLNVTDATQRVFKGLRRLSFLKKLYKMAKMSKEVKMLYGDYPDSPEKMPEWETKVQELFIKVKKSL
ncbi:MAG: NAD(P)/FAD-dependent oxidoreductase [Candidatus Bathyarchaeia archaeon]